MREMDEIDYQRAQGILGLEKGKEVEKKKMTPQRWKRGET